MTRDLPFPEGAGPLPARQSQRRRSPPRKVSMRPRWKRKVNLGLKSEGSTKPESKALPRPIRKQNPAVESPSPVDINDLEDESNTVSVFSDIVDWPSDDSENLGQVAENSTKILEGVSKIESTINKIDTNVKNLAEASESREISVYNELSQLNKEITSFKKNFSETATSSQDQKSSNDLPPSKDSLPSAPLVVPIPTTSLEVLNNSLISIEKKIDSLNLVSKNDKTEPSTTSKPQRAQSQVKVRTKVKTKTDSRRRGTPVGLRTLFESSEGLKKHIIINANPALLWMK